MDSSSGIREFFTQDHRQCDELWAAVEADAAAKDSGLAAHWANFQQRMLKHLGMEEDVLFPAFEAATGMRGMGPTEVMRHEHRQMRGLLAQMDGMARAGDFQGLLNQGDTLLMIIQQHNLKEENMLYAMAENVLASSWPQLHGQLAAYGGGQS